MQETFYKFFPEGPHQASFYIVSFDKLRPDGFIVHQVYSQRTPHIVYSATADGEQTIYVRGGVVADQILEPIFIARFQGNKGLLDYRDMLDDPFRFSFEEGDYIFPKSGVPKDIRELNGSLIRRSQWMGHTTNISVNPVAHHVNRAKTVPFLQGTFQNSELPHSFSITDFGISFGLSS